MVEKKNGEVFQPKRVFICRNSRGLGAPLMRQILNQVMVDKEVAFHIPCSPKLNLSHIEFMEITTQIKVRELPAHSEPFTAVTTCLPSIRFFHPRHVF